MKGRPTKLNDEVQQKIVTAIKAGNYIETAAAYAGINKTTLYDWMKRGSRALALAEKGEDVTDEEIYINFSNAIKKALADSEVNDVALIGKAAKTNWTAAAWRLERKHPNRWGRKDRHEHTGKDGGPITHTVSVEAVEEALTKLDGQDV